MSGPASPALEARRLSPVAERLSKLAALSPTEIKLLEGLKSTARAAPSRTELCAAGTAPPLRVLVSGWACRQRHLSNGRRQVVSFLLPGDTIGPILRPGVASPCTIVAVTEVETVDGRLLSEAVNGGPLLYPGIARAVRRVLSLDEVLLRDQIVRLGRQTAYERVLHFLLEVRDRLAMSGAGTTRSFPFPLTQEMLADALGLSIVHVNRTLQLIRRNRLLELRSGEVRILQPQAMEEEADWTPLPELVE